MNIFKIAFSIIGIFVGAGFASGQEMFSFFYIYGKYGLIGIFVSTMLLAIIIYKSLIISKQYNGNSLINVLIKNNVVRKIVKLITNFFLLSSFYIMISGFSTFFYQEFNINKYITSVVILIICFFIFNGKAEKIINISTGIVPIIIIILLVFALKNIGNYNGGNLIDNNSLLWISSAIIYTSYNSITLIELMGVMSSFLKNKRECLYVSILSSGIIFFLGTIIFCLLGNLSVSADIPLLSVAGLFGRKYKYLYGIVFVIAISTTAISTGYGFIENIAKDKKRKMIYNLVICLFGIPISQLGFASLINRIYPVFGIIGLIQILYILKAK